MEKTRQRKQACYCFFPAFNPRKSFLKHSAQFSAGNLSCHMAMDDQRWSCNEGHRSRDVPHVTKEGLGQHLKDSCVSISLEVRHIADSGIRMESELEVESCAEWTSQTLRRTPQR